MSLQYLRFRKENMDQRDTIEIEGFQGFSFTKYFKLIKKF